MKKCCKKHTGADEPLRKKLAALTGDENAGKGDDFYTLQRKIRERLTKDDQ